MSQNQSPTDDGQPDDEWQEARDLSAAEREIHPYHAKARVGYRLGERTTQACEHPQVHSEDDFLEMRRHFGIPELDIDAFTEKDPGGIVYPDVLIHRRNPDRVPSNKAMSVLIRGKKDSGKTTYLKNLAIQIGDNNNERIIHRGRMDDSGWLELRWWTTLWLPANASVTATWVYEEDEEKSRVPVDDLSEEVREVRYYDGLLDLVDKLGETPIPSYHVVYPDPSFTDCEKVIRQSNKTGEVLPYTPQWKATRTQSPTPLPQWWIAFILCQLEHGHFDAYMGWICDEAHQVFGPQNPSNDDHKTARKFDLANSLLNEARKRMFNWYLATQSEGKLDYRILDEVVHRIYLADGRGNPTKERKSSIPYGWENVPMESDFMSKYDDIDETAGVGLCFIEAEKRGFAQFQWDAFEPHPDDENRWLQIQLGEPEDQVRTSDSESDEEESASLEYDEKFFKYYEQGNQLYVIQPGSGRISLDEPAIIEAIKAPSADRYDSIESLTIANELRRSDDGQHWIITGSIDVPDGNGGVRTVETTFVKIPIDGYQLGGGLEGTP